MSSDNVFAMLVPLMPFLIGWLTRAIMEGIDRSLALINKQKPWVKQIIVLFIAVVLSVIPALVGVDLGGVTQLEQLTATSVNAVLSALFAMISHNSSRMTNHLNKTADASSEARKL